MPDNLRANLRILWAIASKDITDAIRNKTTLSIMLAVGVLMLVGMALPLRPGLDVLSIPLPPLRQRRE